MDKWYFFGIIDRGRGALMETTKTEQRHSASQALDTLPPEAALRAMCAAQVAAAQAVEGAIAQIATAAETIARRMAAGGRLIYAGAGSSGLMALADALEIPGTFGISRRQIVILLSEGLDTLAHFAAETEDDSLRGRQAVEAIAPTEADCLIAVSASGTTPYAVAALQAARQHGTTTVAIANNPAAPLLEQADIAILLDTPPEIIAGSTRLGAGTAQKIALNMISTQVGIHLGHVHDGYMVNVRAENAKLKERARRMVCAIAGCDEPTARDMLALSGGYTKIAILLAKGAVTPDAARGLLRQSGQALRPALRMLQASQA
jgi:N-acetylmuramic acid 6-phosphate etherase